MLRWLINTHPLLLGDIRSPGLRLEPPAPVKPLTPKTLVQQLEQVQETVEPKDKATLVLQDSMQLEERGLLSPEEMNFLGQLKGELTTKPLPAPWPNESQIGELQQIVTKCIAKLKGQPLPQTTNVSAPQEPMTTLKAGAPTWIRESVQLDMKGISRQSKTSIISDVLKKIFTLGLAKTRHHDGVGLAKELEANKSNLLQQVKDKVAKNPDLAYAAISLPPDEVKASIRSALTDARPDLFKGRNDTARESLVNDVYKTMIEAGPIQNKGNVYHVNSKEYTIDKKLGGGGGGMAYRMTCPNGPPLVLKMVESDKQEAFLQEVDAHRYAVGRDDLKNGNIANFIGVVQREGSGLGLVMECVEGQNFGDVQKLIRDDPELKSVDKSLAQKFIMKQILAGMVHVQEDRQMMHLDLKPENVMIDSKTLTAKIIDFGLGKTSQQGDTQHVGTGQYMAPEVTSSNKYDQHADTWSLGIMLFKSEYGHAPIVKPELEGSFGIEQQIAQWAENKDNRVFPPHEDGTPLSPQEELFNKMLHPDPQQRPALSEVLKHPYFQMSEQEEARAKIILSETVPVGL